MFKVPRPALWALVIFLAIVFVLTGSSKLAGPSAMRWDARFVLWGYPAGVAGLIGAIEILSGIGLLVPKTRRPAAVMIIALMIGALATHLVHAEFVRVIPPLVFGGLAFLVTTGRPGS